MYTHQVYIGMAQCFKFVINSISIRIDYNTHMDNTFLGFALRLNCVSQFCLRFKAMTSLFIFE